MLRSLHKKFVILNLFVAITIFACGLLLTSHQQARAIGPAYVRMIHASPYIGIADIFVDGKQLLGSFEFGSVTDYVPIPVGAHKVQISAVGKGLGASVLTQNVTITAGTLYTVAALGASPNALKLQAFIDDNTLMPGTAKVRIYHLSPDYGQATLQIGDSNTLKDMQYQSASSYIQETAGPCLFKASGGEDISLQTSLIANKVTSIFVIGTVNAKPVLRMVSSQVAGIALLEPVQTKSPADQGTMPLLVWAITSIFLIAFTSVSLGITNNLLRRIRYAS